MLGESGYIEITLACRLLVPRTLPTVSAQLRQSHGAWIVEAAVFPT